MSDLGGVYIANVSPGQLSVHMSRSLVDLVMADTVNKWGVWRGNLFNESGANISKGRNQLVQRFLDLPDGDWLLFIDSDMVFPPDTHLRLQMAAEAAGCKVIGGLCVMTGELGPIPTLYQHDTVDGSDGITRVQFDYPDDSLLQVAATGAACLMIHRDVLEKMRDDAGHDLCWFSETIVVHPDSGRAHWISEDIAFCLKAGEAGFSIFVDCTFEIGHAKHGRIWRASDIRKGIGRQPRRTVVVVPTKTDELAQATVAQLAGEDVTEIVVCDNGLDDPAALGPDVIVLDCKGEGIHHMWNAGIRHVVDHTLAARTDVVFLNDDLHLEPGCIAKLVAPFAEQPLDLVALSANYDGRDGDPLIPVSDICAARYDGTGGLAGFAFAVRGEWFTSGYRFPEECMWWYGDNDLMMAIAFNDKRAAIVTAAKVEHLDGGGKTGGDWSQFAGQLEKDREAFEARWARITHNPYSEIVPVEGGSVEAGKAYHDIPGVPGPVHRPGTERRVAHFARHLPPEGNGLDIGCSVGGVSIGLARLGAHMTGVDWDAKSIEIAQQSADALGADARFTAADLTDDSAWCVLDAPWDFAVWLSQWMWLAKQIGHEYAARRLSEVSDRVPVLVFETAQGPGDGMAGSDQVVGPDGVRALLVENTSYRQVLDIGPTPGDHWEGGRHVFVCRRDPVVAGTVTAGYGAATRDVTAGVYGDLGYEPYPGTFNLRTDWEMTRSLLHPERTVTYAGIERRLWSARIEGGDCHVMTHDSDPTVLELIAPVRLRDRFSDGENLQVHVR